MTTNKQRKVKMATKLIRIDAKVADRLRHHCEKERRVMATVATPAINAELDRLEKKSNAK